MLYSGRVKYSRGIGQIDILQDFENAIKREQLPNRYRIAKNRDLGKITRRKATHCILWGELGPKGFEH